MRSRKGAEIQAFSIVALILLFRLAYFSAQLHRMMNFQSSERPGRSV
jgi:hypothetical protein